ncbi:hypothetical protein PN36_27710 [Candidatus Thiomargarita nelsonii]|uniref:ATPase domain protein, prokaryote domain protein n=1 Tax=Candidatus Thiomargarita nelsonii TaxID=1003181 RepID=A0A0A6PCF9_9GAMM|nr:hypothetical protein PN36_27710 [Candidatus Thiomargarita nelsonii]
MIYALEERIGEPSLFCGRTEQMTLLMNWVDKIPRKMAKSRALLGRRKCGKSAIMQRLFNILWNEQGKIIPFYFEVQDYDQWLLDFADVYYRSFMSQYLSFKTRTILSANNRPWDFDSLIDMAKELDDSFALKDISSFQKYLQAEKVDQSMNWAFSAPGVFAGQENLFVLVMIDEIQYMTKHIFYDKEHKVQAHNLPGAYHGLVESKIAPMLVSGSYVGWMVQMMREMFVGGRLTQTPISSKLTYDEGMEAIYRYAEFNQVEVTDESAIVINKLTQSDPFYITCLFRSDFSSKDLSTVDGVIKTLDYEIKNREGELFGTWSEYIYSTIKAVNDRYAKQVLLFLSKERYKECTRVEISDYIGNQLSEAELEEKLRTLEYGDLITQGVNNFRYRGISDDILDLIFRELYQEEIEQVKPNVAKELAGKVANLEKDKKSLQGALNELKGRMLELMVYREMNKSRNQIQPIDKFRQKFRPFENVRLEKLLKQASENKCELIWTNYYLQLPQTQAVELDVLALGEDETSCWALVFEVKNRDAKHPPTKKEAQAYVAKLEKLRHWLEQKEKPIRFVCPVYLSAKGFSSELETFLHEEGVLTADLAFLGLK